MSYPFRVCLPPNSHPSCKCMMMRSQAWAISFFLSCRVFLCLFLSISTKAIWMQQSKHQVTYKSLMNELFCLTGLLQGTGEAAEKKLTWESHRCPVCQEEPTGWLYTKLGISTSSLSPAGFLSTSCFIFRLFEEMKGRIFCCHSYRVVTQCFILLVFLLQNKFCCLFVPWF